MVYFSLEPSATLDFPVKSQTWSARSWIQEKVPIFKDFFFVEVGGLNLSKTWLLNIYYYIKLGTTG